MASITRPGRGPCAARPWIVTSSQAKPLWASAGWSDIGSVTIPASAVNRSSTSAVPNEACSSSATQQTSTSPRSGRDIARAGAIITAAPTSIATGATVMNELNRGTPSSLAWTVLRDGLDAVVAVSDIDAIRAVEDPGRFGISSGPSGAAALAGVRRLMATDGRWGDAVAPIDRATATCVLIGTGGRIGPPTPPPSSPTIGAVD